MIGSHLLYELVKKGGNVRALKGKTSNTEEVRKIFSFYSPNADALFSKIEWIEGDVLDITSLEEAMAGITHVYHCAGFVSLDAKDDNKVMKINREGTSNLVNCALAHKVKKLCYVSSVAALGNGKGKEITEDTPWDNDTHSSAYALSKYLAENEVWRASQEGLEVVIVSPGIVIGPGNKDRSSGMIFKAAGKGLRWYSRGGMGFVDVRDVAKAMILLMNSEVKNENFILTAENISFRKFSELLYGSLNQPLPNKKAGRSILGLAWRVDKLRKLLTGSSLVFTKEMANYASKTLAYSNIKIKKTINIDFIPLSDSVKEAGRYFLSSYVPKKK